MVRRGWGLWKAGAASGAYPWASAASATSSRSVFSASSRSASSTARRRVVARSQKGLSEGERPATSGVPPDSDSRPTSSRLVGWSMLPSEPVVLASRVGRRGGDAAPSWAPSALSLVEARGRWEAAAGGCGCGSPTSQPVAQLAPKCSSALGSNCSTLSAAQPAGELEAPRRSLEAPRRSRDGSLFSGRRRALSTLARALPILAAVVFRAWQRKDEGGEAKER